MWITGYSPTINYIGKFSNIIPSTKEFLYLQENFHFKHSYLFDLTNDHADIYLIMEYFPSKKGIA